MAPGQRRVTVKAEEVRLHSEPRFASLVLTRYNCRHGPGWAPHGPALDVGQQMVSLMHWIREAGNSWTNPY
jgi:hypothetical protein